MYVATPHRVSPAAAALLASRSEALDLRPGPEGFRASPFDVTRDLYRPVLADRFVGPWTYTIVVALAPGQQLAQHVDGPIQSHRFHTVLQTNHDCWVWHDGIWSALAVGGIYQMDPGRPHGAVNWGATVRLHLVIDCDDVRTP